MAELRNYRCSTNGCPAYIDGFDCQCEIDRSVVLTRDEEYTLLYRCSTDGCPAYTDASDYRCEIDRSIILTRDKDYPLL